MTQVRWGLIGLGKFSQLHLHCMKQIPGVSLVAVADLDSLKAKEVATNWGCSGYVNWSEMLGKEKLDVISVLTPEAVHTEAVIAALRAGCHVFVEKPIATIPEEAEEMIKEADKAGRFIMTGHVCRFDARNIAIYQAIQSGKFGKLRSIYARRNNSKQAFAIYHRTNPVFILGIHDIDLMRWYTGSHVTEVFARRYPSAANGSDYDMVWSMLQFANGTVGVLENNWLVPNNAPSRWDIRIEIVGDDGSAHLQDPDQSLIFWSDESVQAPVSFAWNEIYGRYAGALLEELQHFYTCVSQNRPSNILDPQDALEAVRVASAIVRSCETGMPVRISQSA